jgi:hypothetical protein
LYQDKKESFSELYCEKIIKYGYVNADDDCFLMFYTLFFVKIKLFVEPDHQNLRFEKGFFRFVKKKIRNNCPNTRKIKHAKHPKILTLQRGSKHTTG